jgi:ABC-type uncharacterized transport system auxiliary subunit
MKQPSLWILCLCLCGCFGAGSLAPQDHFYRLPRIASAVPQANPLHLQRVAVAGFVADDLHRDRALLFSDSAAPLQLRRYHYHHWAATPSQLLQEHLISYLRHTQFAPQVVRDDEQQSQAMIRGRIQRLERILQPNQTSILVQVELSLSYKIADDIQTVRREYTRESVVADSLLDTSVQAYGLALEDIYRQFVIESTHQLLSGPAIVGTTHQSPAAPRRVSPSATSDPHQ